MTPNKEDYLKALYKLGGAEELVGNKEIAVHLNVAPASVSEMLGKLSREELIEYVPYKGSRLTNKGLQIALALVRGHRLWEVFLIRHLGYSWSEAHEDAELLEHITPPRLAMRLDRFLNYPASCPHGYAIPDADGNIDLRPMRRLSEIAPGDSGRIGMVEEEPELLDYLENLGLKIGSTFTVKSIGAYEGPFTLNLDGKEIQVSYKAACQIHVDADSK